MLWGQALAADAAAAPAAAPGPGAGQGVQGLGYGVQLAPAPGPGAAGPPRADIQDTLGAKAGAFTDATTLFLAGAASFATARKLA